MVKSHTKTKTKIRKIRRPRSLSSLKDELWRWFSLYIRYRDGGVCFTCNKQTEIGTRDSQAGHYVSRTYLPTFIDERNVHCQCMRCNIFLKGNLDEYAIRLRRKYGVNILEELNQKKHDQSFRYSYSDYERLIAYYRSQVTP